MSGILWLAGLCGRWWARYWIARGPAHYVPRWRIALNQAHARERLDRLRHPERYRGN